MGNTPLLLETIFQSMTNALLVLDDELNIVYVNEAALNVFETGLTQIQEKPFNEFFLEECFDLSRFQKAFMKGEEFSEAELQLCFKDGRCTLVDLQANIFKVEHNIYLLLEIMPVDKQRKISQETQQYAQQMAARELIRGLAHEIKNPLGGIRGAAQLLNKQLPSKEQQEFTQMIMEQADRLRGLVDRLLGPNTLPRKDYCNLHEVIEKVRSLILVDQSYSISVTRDYDPSIPDVFGDPDMLQQALLNIVRNASQALKEAKIQQPNIRLKTRIERSSVINGKRHALCALISVIDNGPGIPKELRDTLFYPMVTSKKNGSGLGLSIAQTLTDHHHGKIDLESFPGYTEFTIYIPITIKDANND
ncbi:nitrogen regulation protein NR(II) [Agaribacter marinus]|uniref:nitrogen regulation protein NR(II) n=1 Tax=Agaribacter marinus TaxID=1431249 RepID=UPI0024E0C385|nr:nitrogen regulation protein NR(II) [Agaribacter marinus]